MLSGTGCPCVRRNADRVQAVPSRFLRTFRWLYRLARTVRLVPPVALRPRGISCPRNVLDPRGERI